MAYEKLSPPLPSEPGECNETWTSSCGFRTGSHRSINASIRLKIAVLAPMPRASAARATAVKPMFRRIVRRAYRRSVSSASI